IGLARSSPAPPGVFAILSMGWKRPVFSSRSTSSTSPTFTAPGMWPSKNFSAGRTSHTIAPRAMALATALASTIAPLKAPLARSEAKERKTASAKRTLLQQAVQVFPEEPLGDLGLVVVEEREQLLPVLARLLEEGAVALDARLVGAGEDPEVGARLGELGLEFVLHLHRRERHREQRALRRGDRDVELHLLVGSELEARLELVEPGLQRPRRGPERDGNEKRRRHEWGHTPISIIQHHVRETPRIRVIGV